MTAASADLSPGFCVLHSNRLEALRDLLVAWLKQNPLAPLENEAVLVQSNGMAQWLKLALAGDEGCGISAAQDFIMPSRFLWQAYRDVLGAEQVPPVSAFDKSRLQWRLMRLLPQLLSDERFAPLQRFLEDDHDLRKRYQLAERLADLLDQYQVYRADWLAAWEAGRDVLVDARGRESAIDAAQIWQPVLWRALVADVGAELAGSSRAGVHSRFLQALSGTRQRPVNLPRRIVVFGISSLPRQLLEALHALAGYSQVLLLVNNPCQYYWGDIVAERDLLRVEQRRHPRKPGVDADIPYELLHSQANPLLAAWGRQGRDYIGLLYGYDAPAEYQESFREIDLFVEPDDDSLLAQVQRQVLAMEPLPAEPEQCPALAAEDHSIRFQVAHSPQREVEILHDQLLALFEELPELSPADVAVMVPDIQTYAPHIEAVFGNFSSDDPRHIPFSVADRSERGYSPLLVALETVFSLPEGRLTASDLLGLLEAPSLRARFQLREDDIPRLHQWIEGAGIRWGLHAEQRASLGLPGFEQNSWLFGLRRMLLGYASGDGPAWQGIEPYAEVGGLDAALAGGLADLVQALAEQWRQLSQPVTPAEWRQRLQAMVAALFSPAGGHEATDLEDAQLLLQFDQLLSDWLEACDEAGFHEPLPLAVVRETVLAGLEQASQSQRFLVGRVNFATLMPMRAIPFRVVCLLGMNDDAYPRSQPPLDFDLMGVAGQYRPGDRSRREDDRYLFLEALLSARERLYISWVGRSVRDNTPRPPSVLVGQLQDYLAAGWQASQSDSVLQQLTCEHPLQPFSAEYFQPRRDPRLFTYAREWRDVHDGTAHDDVAPSEHALPLEVLETFTLAMLAGLLRNPARYFFTERLGVWLEQQHAAALGTEPFTVEKGLQSWALTQELMQAVQRQPQSPDDALDTALASLQRRGVLPPGELGGVAVEASRDQALAAARHWQGVLAQWPEAARPYELDLMLNLGEGPVSLLDWLGDLRRNSQGQWARLQSYAGAVTARPDRGLSLWAAHLAGCASGLRLTSLLVGTDGVACLPPLPAEQARSDLQQLAGLAVAGLQQPLPVAAKTALAWFKARDKDPDKALDQALRAFNGNDFQPGEWGRDVWLARAWPGGFVELAARFEAAAESVYGPFRAHWLAGENAE